jgi:hypothetical protein
MQIFETLIAILRVIQKEIILFILFLSKPHLIKNFLRKEILKELAVNFQVH